MWFKGIGTPKGSYIPEYTCPRAKGASQQDSEMHAVLEPPQKQWSEVIAQILSPSAIQLLFHPQKTLKQELVSPKHPIPISKRKGVVYRIPCAECASTYVHAQTGRSLVLHLQEHQCIRKNVASTVIERVFKAGQLVNLSKVWAIDYHPHTQTHCLLESWHIQHHQAFLNTEKGLRS